MKIKKTNRLTAKEVKDVLQLIQECRSVEPTTITPTMSNEGNFDENLPCMFLCYEQGYLMSFVSIFMPSPYYGEVVGFTSPPARKRGYFTNTWIEALKVLGPNIEEMEIMFVTDGKSPSALAVFEKLEMQYQYSEFVMAREIYRDYKGLKVTAKPLDPTKDGDLNAIFMMHHSCFGDGVSETKTFMDSCKMPGTNNFLAIGPEGRPVGIFHITLDGDRAFLFGVGVLPEFQNRGYGKQIVELAMNMCDEEFTHMGLQVSSLNEEACRLYNKCGFEVVNRLDYYYDEM